MKKIATQCVRLAMCGLVAASLVSCGGGGGSPGTVAGGSTTSLPGSVSLLFSSPELKSAGTAGSEVTVTALVKNADNNAVEGVAIQFTADSGALVAADAKTDKNGQAKATLGISGDRTNRTITVNVKAGDKTTTGTINVVGTNIVVAGPPSLTMNSEGEFSVLVRDSANLPIANVPVTFSSQAGNTVSVKSSGGGTATAPLTNAQGQLVLKLTPTKATSDTLSISAQGVTSTTTFGINTSNFKLTVTDLTGKAVTTANTTCVSATDASCASTCLKVTAQYDIAGAGQSGTLNLSSSRGAVYSDELCKNVLTSGTVTITNGTSAPAYISASSPGVATITGTVAAANGPSTQTMLEFVTPLTQSATISVQPDLASIGPGEQSVLTATVRDGTSRNNVVKGAIVEFTIIDDVSGGKLSNPATVTTDQFGVASVSFVAGSGTTATNGVKIQAKIQGITTDKSTYSTVLTVARKSLFISAGTGNSLSTPNVSTYQQDYVVFVTDSSGNRVKDVTVTASVYTPRYRKGVQIFRDQKWTMDNPMECANEDLNKDGVLDSILNEDANGNGVLDAGEDLNNNGVLDRVEDTNGNGRLDPGGPVSVAATAKTDANGSTLVSLLYPKDRAAWTDVQVTFRAVVAGTEGTYKTSEYALPATAADLNSPTVPPPGVNSPYGIVRDCKNPN
jgi:hypothetical protein